MLDMDVPLRKLGCSALKFCFSLTLSTHCSKLQIRYDESADRHEDSH